MMSENLDDIELLSITSNMKDVLFEIIECSDSLNTLYNTLSSQSLILSLLLISLNL